MRPIQRPDGKWIVVDENDNEVAGPFNTEEEAWEWIDNHTPNSTPPEFRP